MSTGVTVLPRKRRGVELVLILFALVITLSAYAPVSYTHLTLPTTPYV